MWTVNVNKMCNNHRERSFTPKFSATTPQKYQCFVCILLLDVPKVIHPPKMLYVLQQLILCNGRYKSVVYKTLYVYIRPHIHNLIQV